MKFSDRELIMLHQLFLDTDPAPTRKYLAEVLGKGCRTIGDLEKIFRDNYDYYQRVWQRQREEKRGALCSFLSYCLWRAVRFYPDPIRPNQVSRLELEKALREKKDPNFSLKAFKEFRAFVEQTTTSRDKANEDGNLRVAS